MADFFARMQARVARQPAAASASARRTTCRPTRSPPRASARPRSARRDRKRTPRVATRPDGRPCRPCRADAADAPTIRCCPAACSVPATALGRRHRAVRLGARTPARAQRRHARATRSANTNACATHGNARRRAALRPGRGAPARQPGAAAATDARGPARRSTPATLWLDAGAGRGRSRAPARRPRPTRASRRCCDRMPQQPRGGADLRRRSWPNATTPAAGKRAQAVLRPLLRRLRRRSGVPADLRPRQRARRRPGPRRRGLCRGRLPERPPRTGPGPARTP